MFCNFCLLVSNFDILHEFFYCSNPLLSFSAMGKKDECWKYNKEFSGRTKFQTKCIFCKEKINSGSIYRLKYHIAVILGHDVTICT